MAVAQEVAVAVVVALAGGARWPELRREVLAVAGALDDAVVEDVRRPRVGPARDDAGVVLRHLLHHLPRRHPPAARRRRVLHGGAAALDAELRARRVVVRLDPEPDLPGQDRRRRGVAGGGVDLSVVVVLVVVQGADEPEPDGPRRVPRAVGPALSIPSAGRLTQPPPWRRRRRTDAVAAAPVVRPLHGDVALAVWRVEVGLIRTASGEASPELEGTNSLGAEMAAAPPPPPPPP